VITITDSPPTVASTIDDDGTGSDDIIFPNEQQSHFSAFVPCFLCFDDDERINESAFTATASKLNKPARLLRPKPNSAPPQGHSQSFSFVVTQSAFKPSHCCADFSNVFVHDLNPIMQVLSVVLALAKFRVKPDPHLSYRAGQHRT
jgi:hypothetical protein